MAQSNYGNISDIAARAGQARGTGRDNAYVAGGGQVEIWSLEVTGAVDDTDYSFDVILNADTHSTTIDSGTGATVTTIAAALVARLNADPDLAGFILASNLAGVITLTGLVTGQVFTTQNLAANMGNLSNTQDAADRPDIPFGICLTKTDENTCELPSASTLNLQVSTLTPVVANSTIYSALVKWNGNQYPATYTSDGSATATEISAGLTLAINTAMPTTSVLATDDDPDVTLSSEVRGFPFEVVITSGNIAVVETTASNHGKLIGASMHTQAYAPATIGGDTVWPGGSSLNNREEGEMYVQLDEGITITTLTDPVYVRVLATGDEQLGRLRNSLDAADACPHPYANWTRASFIDPSGKNIAGVLFER